MEKNVEVCENWEKFIFIKYVNFWSTFFIDFIKNHS